MKNIHDFLSKNNTPYAKWHRHPHSNFFNFLLLTIFSSIIATSLTYTINQSVNAYEEDSLEDMQLIEGSKEKISGKTKKLLDLVYQYEKLNNEDKANLLPELVQSATERHDSILNTIINNPREILNSTINPSVKNSIPAEIKNLIEEKKAIKGKFSHVHMDFFEQDFSMEEYYVEDSTNNKRYRVYFTDKNIPAKTGDTVNITGVVMDNNIAANTEDVQMLTEATTNPSISKKSIVIMFNWQNDTRTTFTESSARTAFFTGANSANSYFKENSFGKAQLIGKVRPDGDVYGWYTIPYDNTNCSTNWDVWDDAADAKARAAGVDLSGYDTKTYVFPSNSSCGWGGLGYMGGNPARSWINGASQGTITHELGHNMGTHHASSYNCTANGARVSISNTCTVNEYGDPYDVMGSSGGQKHMNSYHKGQTGTYAPNWLTTSNTLTIDRHASPDSTYTIAPIEKLSSGIQSLRIPRTVSTTGVVSDYYYLEFRQPFGFDNFATTSAAANGIFIRIAPNYSTNTQSKLLDATPETTSFSDAPLATGKTFNDTYKGISISTLNVGPGGADVRVSFGALPCTNYAPSTSISPSNQSGGAGQTLSYNVTVKNNDAAECAAANFSVLPTLPAGFLQSPTSLSTGPLSPGASITKSINITSSANTTATSNTFVQKSIHGSNSALTSSASGVYSIAAVDTTSPTISISKPTNGSKVPSKGNLSIAVSASDNQGISKIEIYLDSYVIKTCTNTTSCSANLKTNSVSSGVHTITAKAFDTSSNVAVTSIAVSK